MGNKKVQTMSTSKRESIGQRLKRLRESHGWSQEELASKIGSSVQSFNYWEKDKGLPRPYYRRKLADELGLSVEDLFPSHETNELSESSGFEMPDREREFIDHFTELTKVKKEPLALQQYQTRQELPLIGRKQDIENIVTILIRNRVHFLTLFGLGGVGKTELAKQVAMEATIQEHFHVCTLNLESETKSDVVIQQLTDTLKSIPLGITSALIILDNIEQIDGIAQELWNFLDRHRNFRRYSEVTLLATSRTQMSAGDYHVKTLLFPESRNERIDNPQKYPALELFLKGVNFNKLNSPVLELTEETAPLIADICIRLDGLPLALIMASSWIRDNRFTLKGLHEQILNLKIQEEPDPYGRGKHISLEALIGWSFQFLDEQQRKLFRRLSVIPRQYNTHGFSIYSAAAICNLNDDLPKNGDELLPLLRPLKTHNFITLIDDQIQIHHNTLLDFGRRQLHSEGESEGMRQRCIDCTATLELSFLTTKVYTRDELEYFAFLERFSRRTFTDYWLFMSSKLFSLWKMLSKAWGNVCDFLIGKPEKPKDNGTNKPYPLKKPVWADALHSLLEIYITGREDKFDHYACLHDFYSAEDWVISNFKPARVKGYTLIEVFDKTFRQICLQRLQHEAQIYKFRYDSVSDEQGVSKEWVAWDNYWNELNEALHRANPFFKRYT